MSVGMDRSLLYDLANFARLEVASNDLEPWALMLKEITATTEERLWLVKLYNAYDSLGSAWSAYRRWPTPNDWLAAPDKDEAALYPCTQERRGFRGGRILIHLTSYTGFVADGQAKWFSSVDEDFESLSALCRQVWGVGRQSAFEWVEFLAKSCLFNVTATHAHLWDSSGPRRALQRLFLLDRPTPDKLEEAAAYARDFLHSQGIPLSWEDFETVICDFGVMTKGRYYPGRHLGALREEINEVADPVDRKMLADVFNRIIPSPWNSIQPGIDKSLMPEYRDSGFITMPVCEAS